MFYMIFVFTAPLLYVDIQGYFYSYVQGCREDHCKLKSTYLALYPKRQKGALIPKGAIRYT